MKKYFSRHIYYPLTQRLKGCQVLKHLRQLCEYETLSEVALCNLQMERLKQHLQIASCSPFYRRLFKQSGFDPASDLTHFSALPLTTKTMVRQAEMDFINPNFRGKIVYGKTSGSTGISLRLCYDSLWEQRNQAAQLRGRNWWGVNVGSRELVIWGRPFSGKAAEWVTNLKMWLLNRMQINSFEINDRQLDRIFPALIKFNPEVIYGYSTGAGRLAEYILDRFGQSRPLKPKAVIVTSEMLFQPQAETIKMAFGLEAANEYGAAETGIIAFQCPQGGWHISADNLILEIDQPDENGEGKVVITPLLNYAMPLVRYELGDVGRLVKDKCPCGLNLPLFQLSQGRVEEVIVTPKGKTACTAFFAYIGKSLMPLGLRQFRALQKSPVLMHLQLVHSKRDDPSAEALIRRQIKKYLGEEVNIVIEYVEQIPPDSSGKLRYFIREDF